MPLVKTGYAQINSEQYFNNMMKKMLVQFPGMSTEDSNLLVVLIKILADQSENLDVNGLESYNNIYVTTASGVHLDKAVKIAGISRIRGVKSRGTVKIKGKEGTAISSKTTIETANKIKFYTTNDSTVYIKNEEVEIEVIASEIGTKSNVVAKSLDKLTNPILGVTSVVNEASIVGGADRETDAELRARYFSAITSHRGSSLQGIIEFVRNNTTATFVSGEENTGMKEKNGISPKSFKIYVEGATTKEIAEAIFKIKPVGVGTSGDVDYNVEFASSLYNIKFSRATVVNVYYEINCTVDVSKFDELDEIKIKEAIVEYTNTNNKLNKNMITGLIYRNTNGLITLDDLKFDTKNPPINETDFNSGSGEKFTTDISKIKIITKKG